ncbi:MAG TPA: hypothetical protein VEX87_04380 [Skermanella sp.]|nr:hypothetical protein [Skermanella sp.]
MDHPDETTDDLVGKFPEFLYNRTWPNLAAASVSEARVDSLIEQDTNFIVETVLASPKYLERVKRAKKQGMTIGMIYVSLELADLAVARVKARVAAGGHNVDEDKVRKRWATSQHVLMDFIPHLDELAIFDNSTYVPGQAITPFASLSGKTLTCHQQSGLPHLRRIVQNAMMTGIAGFSAVGF